MRLFALNGSQVLGEQVASYLDRSLDLLEERSFDDGEHKIRPLVSVRDEDVYVIHSLGSDSQQSVNDKLCKLLFFIATLKDCGAKRVTAVLPYLCYARKDRKTKARDPVTLRYVASLFEAVGTDRIVAIDVHNLQAFQNAFRCSTEHLQAHNLFANYFHSIARPDHEMVVMSPDIGGVKRAELFRERLSVTMSREVGFAFMEKLRSKGTVSGEAVVGNVVGKDVIILDDLINSGTTMGRASAACERSGATAVYAMATHGMFTPDAKKFFQQKSINKVVITNTVDSPLINEMVSEQKLVVLNLAPMFAETIRRLQSGGSLVSLMDIE